MRVSQSKTMARQKGARRHKLPRAICSSVLFLGVPILVVLYAWSQMPPQSTSCSPCPCSCSWQAPFSHSSHRALAPSLKSSSPGPPGSAPSASAQCSPRQVPGAGSHLAAAQHEAVVRAVSSLSAGLHFSRPMRLTPEVMIMIFNKD